MFIYELSLEFSESPHYITFFVVVLNKQYCLQQIIEVGVASKLADIH